MSTRLFPLIFIALFLVSSCKRADTTEEAYTGADTGATYFSIKQFILDQYNTYHEQPFGFVKIVYLNGKVDSSLVTTRTVEWGPIFKAFFDTDIGHSKFLNQYDFTMFEDNATDTRNFYYEAKNDKLYTRKLQISADMVSSKVRSIYIEAIENTRWHGKTCKLFYMPLKLISIQEFEKSTPGPDKELRVEYRFL
jgi:hypothetical protein